MASTILADNGVSSGSAGLKSTADSTGVLALQTTTSGGAVTTAVTVDNAQNVGVSVTPSAWNSAWKALQIGVSGNATYTANSLFLTNNGYNNGTNWVYQATTGSAAYEINRNTSSHIWYNAPSGTAGNAITFTQAMTLDASGRLLLGSTTADGNLGATGFQITSAETCQIIRCTNATGQAVRFYSSTSTQAGFITVSGATASYNSASDYRLKENVTPLVGALAIVNGLRPVKYTWKVDGCDGEGFIAHELQESIPLAVQGTKDQLDNEGNISPQGIDQSKIVPYLVKAIQEQQALITSLTERITALEGAKA